MQMSCVITDQSQFYLLFLKYLRELCTTNCVIIYVNMIWYTIYNLVFELTILLTLH